MNPYRPLPKVGPKEWPLYVQRAIAGLVLGVVVALVFTATPSCSPTAQQTVTNVGRGLTPAVACIVTQIADGGVADPQQILDHCVGVTVEDIVAVIESLIAAQPVDAGPATAYQLRLVAMHTRALGMRVGGK